MKIYTRTGDRGETGLLGGRRVAKNDLCIEAVGGLDELNCSLGVVLSTGLSPANETEVLTIQRELFVLGARLAGQNMKNRRMPELGAARVGEMEHRIDAMTASLPELDAFILPGGVAVAAQLHQSRAVCRRAERAVVAFAANTGVESLEPELAYLNRLGDLLFVMARFENLRLSGREEKWIP